MKKLIVSVALASLSLLAWALPTLQQVEAKVHYKYRLTRYYRS